MFSLAIIIGIYSYLIFSLGLLGLLYKGNLFLLTVFFLTLGFFYYRKIIKLKFSRVNKWSKIFLGFIVLQAIINLIGALGPELGFDALWYHLTIPKIFLLNHQVFYIPGGLFYFSLMPKLMEMIYTSMISLGGETLAKITQFLFGMLSLIAIYKISKKFLSTEFSLFSALLFYSSLVVSWESITAYVDLARTFFETMALWGFLVWIERKNKRWLIESAVMLGLSISTKILSIASVLIFLILIVFTERKINKKIILNLILFSFVSIFVAFPYLLFSFINTRNPFYPFFSKLYAVGFSNGLLSPLNFIKDVWNIFTHSQDPISPAFIIFAPLIFIYFKKLNFKLKIIVLYSMISIFVWYLTPRTGGGRFILPFLPAFSILISAVIQKINNSFLKNLSIAIVIFISIISIFYRMVANSKYIGFVFGRESKQEFLSNNLNFSFGDFYDTDSYFKKYISSSDKVLLYGFHNLYYINFPFIDSSYVKSGDQFNYIAVQNAEIPARFKFWKLIYSNPKTHVNLYSLGGRKWIY